MDEIAGARLDRLETWVAVNRKDLLRLDGSVSPGKFAAAVSSSDEEAKRVRPYWSDVFRRAKKSFAASAARSVEVALGMPHLHLEGVSWPFDEVEFERWDRLNFTQKGMVQKAMLDEIEKIEARTKLKTGTGS